MEKKLYRTCIRFPEVAIIITIIITVSIVIIIHASFLHLSNYTHKLFYHAKNDSYNCVFMNFNSISWGDGFKMTKDIEIILRNFCLAV